MKTVELLKERYFKHIANEYGESRELSLANFDGHDMIEFAEYYHQQKLAEDDSKRLSLDGFSKWLRSQPVTTAQLWLINNLIKQFKSTQEDK